LLLFGEDARRAEIRQFYLTVVVVQDVVALDVFVDGLVVMQEFYSMHRAVANIRDELLG